MRVSFHTAVIPILRILVLSACGEAPEPDNPAYWTLSLLELGAEGGGYPSALYIEAGGSLRGREKRAYSFYDLPEGFHTGSGSVDSLRQLDRNGGEIQRVELGGSQGFSMDRDGIRYVLVQEELRVLNSEWELLFAI